MTKGYVEARIAGGIKVLVADGSREHPCPYPAIYDHGECCGMPEGNCARDRTMSDTELRRAAAAMVEQLDMLMPEIEKAIDVMWRRGDYFNAPRFGATLEALRAAAIADRSPKGGDKGTLSSVHESGGAKQSPK